MYEGRRDGDQEWTKKEVEKGDKEKTSESMFTISLLPSWSQTPAVLTWKVLPTRFPDLPSHSANPCQALE